MQASDLGHCSGDSAEEEVKEPCGSISKRELKKQRKMERFEAKKAYQRQKEREKGKKSNTAREHIVRFNRNEAGEPVKLTTREKQQMFKDLCLKGPRIIVDLDFESLQTDKEIKSLCSQMAFCTNINKQAKTPCNLIFSGVGSGQVHQQLSKQSF